MLRSADRSPKYAKPVEQHPSILHPEHTSLPEINNVFSSSLSLLCSWLLLVGCRLFFLVGGGGGAAAAALLFRLCKPHCFKDTDKACPPQPCKRCRVRSVFRVHKKLQIGKERRKERCQKIFCSQKFHRFKKAGNQNRPEQTVQICRGRFIVHKRMICFK